MLARTALMQRGYTPFMAFSITKRPEIVATGKSPVETFKHIGLLWREMPDAERDVWAAKAAQMTEARAEARKSGQSVKIVKEPKRRTMPVFGYYTIVMRDVIKAEKPHLKNTEIIREIAARYRALSKAEKEEITKKALEYKKQ